MKWAEIRTHYPQQWLMIEAIKAHSEKNKRILDEISIVGKYPEDMQIKWCKWEFGQNEIEIT